jgi:probable rRNA maturation factor
MDDEPNYDISVTSDELQYEGIAPVVQRAVEAALCHHGVVSAAISLAIVNDRTIARLNEQHLNHHGPTDVLTFNLGESFPAPASRHLRPDPHVSTEADAASPEHPGVHVDGEIVVSWETAQREAGYRNHPIEAELALYAVHGVLHLLGYDDHDEERARQMHTIEDDLLSSLGLGRVFTANEQTHSSMRNDVSSAAS